MNIHVYLYTRYVQFFVILYVMKSKKQGYFEEVNNKKMTLIFTLLHHKHKDILSSIYKIFSISIFKKCQKTQLQPWVKGQVMTKKKYSCISICRVLISIILTLDNIVCIFRDLTFWYMYSQFKFRTEMLSQPSYYLRNPFYIKREISYNYCP